MHYTTLNKIRSLSPCKEGWEKLLFSLGKTKADDEQLSMKEILDSNGIGDAIWCIRALDKEVAVNFAIYCSETVLPIFEDMYPDDVRPRKAIEAAKNCHAVTATAAYAATATAVAANAAAIAAYADSYAAAANAAANAAYAAAAAAANAAAAAAYSAAAAAAAADAAYAAADRAAADRAAYAAANAASYADRAAKATNADTNYPVLTITKQSLFEQYFCE